MRIVITLAGHQQSISAITTSVAPSVGRSSKQKLFFYFNYDKTIQHGGTSPTLYTIPTTAAMSGDFTGQATIYDPTKTTTQATGTYLYPGQTVPSQCPCVIRQSFASEYGNGNKIPASRFDPVAAAIQKYYPASNAPGQNVNTAGLHHQQLRLHLAIFESIHPVFRPA